MQYSSESYFFLAGIVSVRTWSLQIWVRMFPQSLIFLYANRLLSSQCSTAAAPAAVDSDSCDRRWMFWVLEIYTWILISDILLLFIVSVVGWTCRYFKADSPRLEVSLLRGWFSKAGGLSRLLLVGWRIIEAPACWLEDHLGFCLFGLFCR